MHRNATALTVEVLLALLAVWMGWVWNGPLGGIGLLLGFGLCAAVYEGVERGLRRQRGTRLTECDRERMRRTWRRDDLAVQAMGGNAEAGRAVEWMDRLKRWPGAFGDQFLLAVSASKLLVAAIWLRLTGKRLDKGGVGDETRLGSGDRGSAG